MGEEFEVRTLIPKHKFLELIVLTSIGKSRKLGWHGFVDSHEAIYEAIGELAELKMVPPIPNEFDRVIEWHGY